MSGTTPAIPEFSLGIGNRQNGNAAATFANQMLLIGAGSNSNIFQTLYALDAGLESANLTDRSLWQSSQLQLQSEFKPQTGDLCAAVVLGGDAATMYLAWNQPNAGILAAACTGLTSSGGSSGVPQWGDGFLLRDQSGAMPTVRSGGSDVCAASLGSHAFLLAYPVEQGGQPAAFIGLYYVADQTATTVSTKAGNFAAWNARASVVLSLADFAVLPGNPPGFDIYDTGSTISIVTIPSVAAGAGDSENQLTLNLVGFMTVNMDKYESGDSGKKTNKFWWPMQFMLPLDTTGAPLLAGAQTIWTAGMLPKSNATAICDPAGRIVSCAASEDWPTGNLKVLTFGVFQTYTMPPSLAPDGILTAAPSAANPARPALLFIVDAGTTPVGSTTTTYPVYLLAFYGSTTVAQLIDYGSIQVTSNYAVGHPLTQTGSGTVVALASAGIIDGPIPVPNQNIAGWQFESTNNDLGSITYGNAASQGTQTQQSWNYNLGVQTSGQLAFGFMGNMVGLAWNASFSGGQSRVWGGSATSTITTTLQQTSMINPQKPDGPPPYTTQIGVGIDPWGVLWAADSGVSYNNFRFLRADGMVISDGSMDSSTYMPLAPIQASSVPAIGKPSPYNYVPYMVTPGNLLSYTIDGPGGIDATMAALTGIANYFETIIWPGAFTFMAGTASAANYLLFSWDVGAVSGQGFNYVTGTVNTSSWQVNASAYAGFFWDSGSTTLFGESTKGSVMIGGSGGYSSSTTTSTSDQWGIAIAPPPGASPPFGPPNWGEAPNNVDPSLQAVWDAAVAKYEFALLLLPDPGADAPAPLSPGYWTRELIQYGNTNATTASPAAFLPEYIDPTIGCWKIVYVVLSVQTNADLNNDPPTYTYCYTDPNGWFGGSRCVAEAVRRNS